MSYSFDPGARRGDSFTRTLRYLEDNGTTPIDLTGASVEWGLAPVPDGTPKLQFVDDSSASITDEAQGTIVLALTPIQTRALKARAYAFEVTLTYAGGTRETILDGFLPVTQEVVEVVP
jgi:hypothetical protein